MPSIIEGYNYDIFISYRQKDNKGDRWVSEFVDSLKTELESTFKEEISVYFDINPHDGLLETHDVDASLKDKLRCLVFIPIISRTYCDPKSFAWEHEFKTFVEQASQDKFGLKVRLPNGNVASRVLPIRIHDLDVADVKMFEGVTGSIMRTSDFIFKTTSGVNRPLKAKEDHPNDNLNKTYYQDQINKVSLTIKEIITSIGHHEQKVEEVSGEVFKPLSVPKKSNKTKIIAGSVTLLALIIVGLYFIPKLSKPKELLEKSIAVLPFFNDSPDEENTHFINGIMDEILNNLQVIKDLRVVSRSSVEQYRGTARPAIPKIAKILDVNYIVEGSGQKYGNSVRLRVQLIEAATDKHLWAESYEQEIKETKDIFDLQSQIAESIASELKTIIAPEEKNLIEKSATTSLTALDFYQSGREELTKYLVDINNKTALQKAEDLFHKALKYDSAFAQAYTGLAQVYWGRHSSANEYYEENYGDSALILCNTALRFDNNMAEAYSVRGNYYRFKGFYDKAKDDYDKTLKINPNSWEAFYGIALLYVSTADFLNCIDNLQKAASLNHGPLLPSLLRSIAWQYSEAGFLEKAKYYNLEALKLSGDSALYFENVASFEEDRGNFEKEIEFMQKNYAIDSTNLGTLYNLGFAYSFLGQLKESLKYYKKYVEILKARGRFTSNGMHRIGYAYWGNGYKKEADYYFDKQLEYSNNSIELKRPIGQSLYAYYDIAAVYAFRGDKEKAYENLNLLKQRSTVHLWAVTYMKTDPLFNSIRNEPEFQQIIRVFEAKFQAEHDRVQKWLEETEQL